MNFLHSCFYTPEWQYFTSIYKLFFNLRLLVLFSFCETRLLVESPLPMTQVPFEPNLHFGPLLERVRPMYQSVVDCREGHRVAPAHNPHFFRFPSSSSRPWPQRASCKQPNNHWETGQHHRVDPNPNCCGKICFGTLPSRSLSLTSRLYCVSHPLSSGQKLCRNPEWTSFGLMNWVGRRDRNLYRGEGTPINSHPFSRTNPSTSDDLKEMWSGLIRVYFSLP